MKLLQLCHKPLSGQADGGKLAMKAMRDGLRENGASVFSWMIETPQHRSEINTAEKDFSKSFFIDTRIKPLAAFWALVNGKSYNLSRFSNSAARKDIAEIIKTFKPDCILAEGIFTLAGWAEAGFGNEIPVILRTHNIEFLIWERMAAAETNPLRRWYLKRLAASLKREEVKIWSQVRGILAISDQDANLIRSYLPKVVIETVGIGFELLPYQKRSFDSDKFFHLGAMDWRPNREGMDYFLNQVWPLLRKDRPGIELKLAGKGMPDAYKDHKNEGVFVAEANDSVSFMIESGVMVVPLLSGSGVRVKIIEGMMLGIPIISTTLGFEGIPAKPGKEILVADTPQSFRLIFNQLASSPDLLNEVSENARKFAAENYRKDVLGLKALNFIRELI
jgi:glycosyltransferase involved in cell wall biosynthesis